MGPVPFEEIHFHSNSAYKQLVLDVVCCICCIDVISVLTVKSMECLIHVTLMRVRILQAPQNQW